MRICGSGLCIFFFFFFKAGIKNATEEGGIFSNDIAFVCHRQVE